MEIPQEAMKWLFLFLFGCAVCPTTHQYHYDSLIDLKAMHLWQGEYTLEVGEDSVWFTTEYYQRAFKRLKYSDNGFRQVYYTEGPTFVIYPKELFIKTEGAIKYHVQ